jgi:hypothetical protein
MLMHANRGGGGMRASIRSAVVAVCAIALVACAGQSTIYNNMIGPAYRPYLYGYGAGRRDLTTVIVGNPFDIDQGELDTKVVAMLNESPTFVQPTNFTTTPGPSARPEFKAVILFNRAVVLPNQVCRIPEQVPVADLGSTLRLSATFCQYGGYLSTVTGELEGATDIDDPRLRTLTRQMVPLLFPPIDPTEDEHQNPFLITNGGLRGSLG